MKTLFYLSTLSLLLAACQPSGNQQADSSETASTALDTAQYKKKGMEIAMGTFAVLSGQLQQAMQEGGVAHAVQYCNTAAYPLVDSLSEVHQARIRRVSDKLRNPADAPGPEEQAMLDDYRAQMQAGEQPSPQVRQLASGEIAFYAPIFVQGPCLNCHGTVGEQVKEADYAVIKGLYPEDEAVGYQAGDLRGAWSIVFAKAE